MSCWWASVGEVSAEALNLKVRDEMRFQTEKQITLKVLKTSLDKKNDM